MQHPTDSRPPVSAYIRSFNEERLIGKVISAAFLVAREVIVIDSGSTDRTIEIARDAGARIIHQEWLGWGHQKRAAEEACKYNWLLDLDADEVVTPELAEEINQLFQNGEPPQNVYRTMLALAPPHSKPWREFGLQSRHKLYDRRIARMPAHGGWDQFILKKGLSIGHLQEPAIHYAYTELSHLMDKLNRNSSIEVPLKPKSYLRLRIFFGLPLYFSRRYFLEQYFRGGVDGFILAFMYGHARWLRDIKMWERHKANDAATTQHSS